jgi:hypothetical protein
MPRFRRRISLLAGLLLMTITGMALVIVQLSREIGPLRAEVTAWAGALSLASSSSRITLELTPP